MKNTHLVIEVTIALLGQLSLSVGWENGLERGLRTVSLNDQFSVFTADSADPDQTPRSKRQLNKGYNLRYV